MGKKRIHHITETGFKTPKGYFTTLEDSTLNRMKAGEFVRNPGFKTPDHYFSTLEDRVMENVIKKEASPVISIFSKQKLIYASSIAAAIALLLIWPIFKAESNIWNHLDTETVENYFIEENMGTYEIATLLLEEDIKEEEIVDYHLNEDQIESYLLNHTEVEDLILEKNNY
ncbi:hypothetical protein [Aestuariivivens sediminis]|uniref:hypothetical protein n=1 Tax=Aestuariivivens sediminis TaxID=2913557 RepID=UPI001F58A53C|nr:hypothetical protein [Aestuariivivens sediminis]